MQNLEQLTRLVCQVAREAGSYIRTEREGFSLEKVERKHAHDYVSYVDKGSEERIVKTLREILPEAGFITEEGLASHTDEQLLWVVDPLDGTTNFIHGFAPYAVSIALIQGDTILVGVVYEISADECFYAWSGLYFPYNTSETKGKDYSGHEHSFEGVIHALLEDPEGFTIEGFEDHYSQQEQEMLAAIQRKLLKRE